MDLQSRSATPNSVYDVECDGGEEMLLQCLYQPGPRNTSCHDAGVVCQGAYTHIYKQTYIHMYSCIYMYVPVYKYYVSLIPRLCGPSPTLSPCVVWPGYKANIAYTYMQMKSHA